MRSFIFGLALTAVLMPTIQIQAAESDSRDTANQIAKALKQSGQLKDYYVGVKCEDGAAWLMGSVTSLEQKRIAEQLARDCEHVTHVVSRLVVDDGAQQVTPKCDLAIKVASNHVEAGWHEQKLQAGQRSEQRQPENLRNSASTRRRTPHSNMPVPYARTNRPQGGIHPAAYSRQAQNCPNGVCQTGGMEGTGPATMGAGRPVAVGQGINHDNPQMPGYAWPSYAASPNYAALTYPKQYSASAWPYIGPFYPYPQVPLGWRKVTLEWDDGFWNLDFSDCR
ncbi:MAG: BON domain-containing protein [Pirellulales bacterium]|nr:BON domain-containing protein [Pirellulales bacterium]